MSNKVTYEIASIPAAGTVTTGSGLRGRIAYVQYTRPATTPYDAGATVTITVNHASVIHGFPVLSGVNLNTEFLLYPRASVHDANGAVIAGLATQHILASASITISITGGGAVTNTGDFLVVFEG